jgi:chaperonin GroES
MALKLRPLGDRVVVEPLEQDERTESGLFIPETAKEKPQKGKIIAVGDGRRDDEGNRIPMDVKVGETILFAKYGGTEVKMESTKILILKESDILAVLD